MAASTGSGPAGRGLTVGAVGLVGRCLVCGVTYGSVDDFEDHAGAHPANSRRRWAEDQVAESIVLPFQNRDPEWSERRRRRQVLWPSQTRYQTVVR